LENHFKPAIPLPLLKAPMTRLIGRIAVWQVLPLRSRPQNPKHTIQNSARVSPWPSLAIGASSFDEHRLQDFPLIIAEILHLDFGRISA
jgi:hypothetical protein